MFARGSPILEWGKHVSSYCRNKHFFRPSPHHTCACMWHGSECHLQHSQKWFQEQSPSQEAAGAESGVPCNTLISKKEACFCLFVWHLKSLLAEEAMWLDFSFVPRLCPSPIVYTPGNGGSLSVLYHTGPLPCMMPCLYTHTLRP